MKQLMSKVMAFLNEEEGLSMVEYAVAGAIIAVAVAAAANTIGTALTGEATTLAGLIKP